MRLFYMNMTTFRQRLRAARYLEEERRTLRRCLGNSTAVDIAIARNIPAGDLRRWFRLMSHRRSRMRMMGVSYADVIQCFRKASFEEVKRNPRGPWQNMRVALALVSQQPRVVEHLPDSLKDNTKVMRAAVTQDGSLIQWASARLRADSSMVVHAVQGGDGPTVFRHVPEELRSNREVVLAAVVANCRSIQCVDKSFYNAEDIVMAASFDFPALPLASQRLLENKDFVHSVCRQCRARAIGPNLMPFLEDTEELTKIAAWLQPAIMLCRVRLISGKGVLTSFSTNTFTRHDWRRDFLGLHVLFEEDHQDIEGYTICNGTRRDMENWELIRALWYDCGLKRNELNEVTLVPIST